MKKNLRKLWGIIGSFLAEKAIDRITAWFKRKFKKKKEKVIDYEAENKKHDYAIEKCSDGIGILDLFYSNTDKKVGSRYITRFGGESAILNADIDIINIMYNENILLWECPNFVKGQVFRIFGWHGMRLVGGKTAGHCASKPFPETFHKEIDKYMIFRVNNEEGDTLLSRSRLMEVKR